MCVITTCKLQKTKATAALVNVGSISGWATGSRWIESRSGVIAVLCENNSPHSTVVGYVTLLCFYERAREIPRTTTTSCDAISTPTLRRRLLISLYRILPYTGQHFLSLKCSTFNSFNPFLSCTISYFHHFIFFFFFLFLTKSKNKILHLKK